MDWLAAVDGYCERTGPGLWAEPLNALTNAAFVAAAAVMWRRVGRTPAGQGRAGTGRVLAAILAAIGAGSAAFHTWATPLAGLFDTVPIAAFVLAYVFVAWRDFFGQRGPVAAAGVVLAAVAVAALAPVFARLPGFSVSAGYWPVAMLIAAHAAALRGRAPQTARGLWLGAGMLAVSLVARSADGALCPRWPAGTHFLWHLVNAAMLGWMIEVWRRHAAAAAAATQAQSAASANSTEFPAGSRM